ncbi:MAG TPA: DUF2155 domain-containing protein [Sphingorhabdus lacus]|nr:DUF2155 domain-containing protein [Sphingorhabdus lacus]
MTLYRGLMLVPFLAVLAACGSSGEDDAALAPTKSGKPQATRDKIVATGAESLGTPMTERVAVLGLLNKRNGQTRDIELKPGEAIRFGKVVVRVRACEKTAPWETRPDEGAFVQLIVNERPPGTTQSERWRQVFSGWLFKENPAANVVEHAIYDVWVKACKMSFPGEEEAVDEKSSDAAPAPAAKKPSNAPQTPAPAETPDDAGDADNTTDA